MYRSLTYGCWASVVQYLEANVRFRFFQHCPEIAKPCHNVPLTIDHWELNNLHFSVNGVSYQIGVIRHCIRGELSQSRKEDNQHGGVCYDVEQFGDPEDYYVQKRVEEDQPLTEEEMQVLETQRARLRELEAIGIRSPKLDEQWALRNTIMNFEFRLANSQAEYCHLFLFLTFDSKLRSYAFVDATSYTKPFKDANNFLIQRMFPERVRVKTFRVNFKILELNLPIKFLTVDYLIVHKPAIEILNALEPMLAHKSINKMKLSNCTQFDHPLIMNSKELELRGPFEFVEVPHHKVQYECVEFTTNNAVELIQNWKSSNYSTGRQFTVEIRNMNKVENLWKLLGEYPGAIRANLKEKRTMVFSYCITIPMSNATELNVFCTDFLEVYSTSCHLNFNLNPTGFSCPI